MENLHFLKYSLRNFKSNKLYTIIMILSLCIGFTISTIIFLYVAHEYSYDTFHRDYENIFRITTVEKIEGESLVSGKSSIKFSEVINKSLSSIDDKTSLIYGDWKGKDVVKYKNEQFYIKDLYYGEPSFFKLFSFPVKMGNENDLNLINSAFISEALSQKIFSKNDVIGKIIYVNKSPILIKGVFYNLPSNTIIKCDLLISLRTKEISFELNKNLSALEALTFLRINDVSQTSKLEDQINKLSKFFYKDKKLTYYLTPLTELHLNSPENSSDVKGYLKNFLLIGVIILIITIINYVNLSTSNMTYRMKEVIMKKILGSSNRILFLQFVIEYSLIVLLGFLFSMVIVIVIKNNIFDIFRISVDKDFYLNKYFLSIIFILLIVIITSASIYPALFLSSKSAVKKFNESKTGYINNIRSILLTVQLAVTIVLVFSFITIKKQISYLQSKDLGIKFDNVLCVTLSNELSTSYGSFIDEIKGLNSVKSVALSNSSLFNSGFNIWEIKYNKLSKPITFVGMSVDYSFIKTLNIAWHTEPLLENSNKRYTLVNSSAAKVLGIYNNPIGTTLDVGGNIKTVDGVVKDFHYTSTKKKIEPILIFVGPDTGRGFQENNGTLYIKFKNIDDNSKRVNDVENIWKKYIKEDPFDYYFINDAFKNLYVQENQLLKFISIITIAAIIISGFGLFGLIAFLIEKKTKDIAIKKLLGASIAVLFFELYKKFFLLIFIASIIALPLATVWMYNWLSNFAYKVVFNIYTYLISATIPFVICLITLLVYLGRVIHIDIAKTLNDS